MINRIDIVIADEKYTLKSPEAEEYILRVADIVNSEYKMIKDSTKAPKIDALVLASCNIADKYLKGVDGTDNLRAQVREYCKEADRLRQQLLEARKEIARLEGN